MERRKAYDHIEKTGGKRLENMEGNESGLMGRSNPCMSLLRKKRCGETDKFLQKTPLTRQHGC
ncbi:hypothetical protein ERIC1_1c33400 [Paenibacillus larvae subsp. larvae DSM 25719]|uniref:Uncharacterized protein n=1 Tax=Paenibacillus larvae subsp. larvae DSM 25430 TaxID=697284 RepID=V9WAJ9_9BACL|nr:hypothetical protein ERIC2_c34780 [Paenibacillus larvae subsp. larvae DSM 25430]ETK29781.1 hypothetical protein ERIC1_1c33400 [Paenibacillus larvae subsp. larvae DSM 25719]